MSTIVIIIILVIVFIIASKYAIKHFKGEGGCCGGGSSNVKVKSKKLDTPVISKKTIYIDGMHCNNCVNTVTNALNSIDGVSAKVFLKQNKAIVSMSKSVSNDKLIDAITQQNFKVKSIS